MYIPKQFEESNVDVMHELIRARPLATLITLSPDGLNANHLPFHLLESPAPFGCLQGHVARANPVLDDLGKNIETLVVFHGPTSISALLGTPQKSKPEKLCRPGTMP